MIADVFVLVVSLEPLLRAEGGAELVLLGEGAGEGEHRQKHSLREGWVRVPPGEVTC